MRVRICMGARVLCTCRFGVSHAGLTITFYANRANSNGRRRRASLIGGGGGGYSATLLTLPSPNVPIVLARRVSIDRAFQR